MKDDDQYKKNLRLTVVSFIIFLLVMLGFATYLSLQLTTYQNNSRNQKVTFVKGQEGKPGATIIGPIGDIGPRGYKGDKGDKGDTGDIGLQGSNGYSVTGPQGEVGAQGDPGINGRDVELCYQRDGTTLGQRFVGDNTCKAITVEQAPAQGGDDESVSWGQ